MDYCQSVSPILTPLLSKIMRLDFHGRLASVVVARRPSSRTSLTVINFWQQFLYGSLMIPTQFSSGNFDTLNLTENLMAQVYFPYMISCDMISPYMIVLLQSSRTRVITKEKCTESWASRKVEHNVVH